IFESAAAAPQPSAAAQAFVAARASRKLPVEARISALEPAPLDDSDVTRLEFDFLTRVTRQP
ncbi:MAG TPA: hypothetical protein VI504_04135, partial [Candidatus Eisenbacteria bacterium]